MHVHSSVDAHSHTHPTDTTTTISRNIHAEESPAVAASVHMSAAIPINDTNVSDSSGQKSPPRQQRIHDNNDDDDDDDDSRMSDSKTVKRKVFKRVTKKKSAVV